MVDIFSKQKRSEIMRSVRSAENKSTEKKLIQLFKKNKISGWRRNYRVFGRPDFVFPKKKIVVFADGCFWHGHNCRNLTPVNNKEYWQKKIHRNVLRDRAVTKVLKNDGWKVVRIWECRIKSGNIKKLYTIWRTDLSK
jgi:DNA mismatch endonuclease (patch repair protein)